MCSGTVADLRWGIQQILGVSTLFLGDVLRILVAKSLDS